MPVVRGSCLCGGVKFTVDGPMLRPLNCHCSICRKQNGSAFRSRVRVRRDDFTWVQGEDLVTFYESTPGYHRGFCRRCGSPILNKADPDFRLVAANPAFLNEYGIALGALTMIRACARPLTSLSAAKRRGSRSPTICRSTTNCHRRLDPAQPMTPVARSSAISAAP